MSDRAYRLAINTPLRVRSGVYGEMYRLKRSLVALPPDSNERRQVHELIERLIARLDALGPPVVPLRLSWWQRLMLRVRSPRHLSARVIKEHA